MITVRQLIEHLSKFDPELEVRHGQFLGDEEVDACEFWPSRGYLIIACPNQGGTDG